MRDEPRSAVDVEDQRGKARLVLDSFGVRAAGAFETERCTMQLSAGELGLILGPIGSGKSLLAEVVSGVQRPEIEVLGRFVAPPRVSFVPQDPRLAVLATDRVSTLLRAAFADHVPMQPAPSWLQRWRARPQWRVEGEALLERLRLTPARILRLEFRELSSSERHRVLLALAFAEKTPLLVYDGLAEGLDRDDRERVAGMLRERLSERGMVLATARAFGTLDLGGVPTQIFDLDKSSGRASALPLMRRSEAQASNSASPRPLLEVVRLRVARGKRQLGGGKREAIPVDGASFFVNRGESLVLFGGAGSGKTTLLEALAGLLRPLSGRVLLRERDVTWGRGVRSDRLRQQVQLVFQDASEALDPGRTVQGLLDEARRLAPAARTMAHSKAAASPSEWLERLALPERLLGLSADRLSLGEAQRIDLARSLVLGPELVLLDAPRVSGADTDGGALAALISSRKHDGMSFLVATSDPGMATALGDRVAVLHAGRVVEMASAEAVLKRPSHPVTLALLAGDVSTTSDPRTPLRGCPFVGNCPRRSLPQCDQEEPKLSQHPTRGDSDHRVACFHPLP